MMKHTVQPVHYDDSVHPEFQADLRERVKTYLRDQPNGRFGTPFMAVKIAFFIGAFAGMWAWLALIPHTLPVTILSLAGLAVLAVGLAYNVSHEAVHHVISRRSWVNELLYHGTFNLLGPNAYLWRLRHKVMHHTCVNIPGLDFNIEASDILRFSPTQQWRPIHRYQHLYAPVLYAVFTLHWVFVKDFTMLRLAKIGNLDGIEHPPGQIVGILAWKGVYVTLMLIVPTVVLPWSFWQVLAGFVLYQMMTSVLFVLTFTGSHLNRGLTFVPYVERVPHSFLEHALHTSCDFHPTNPVVSFLMGGFNTHVAHHMFPSICSVHYPALTRIIQDTARAHGLPYKQMNVLQLFVSHFAYLHDLGQDAHSADATYLHTA